GPGAAPNAPAWPVACTPSARLRRGRAIMEPTGTETQTEPVRAEQEGAEVNGIDTAALFHAIEDIKADPTKASCKFAATTQWRHGTASTCRIDHFELGGEQIPQDYAIAVDEPAALLGTDSAPNPQMLLYAALTSCVLN